jgi:hypothetical protein
MPYEDYMHYGWHKIKNWNEMVFANAKQKAEEEFDALLRRKETGRRKKMSTVPKGNTTVWRG